MVKQTWRVLISLVCPENHRVSTDRDFQEAWHLFLTMHNAPTAVAAQKLIEWLRGNPGRVRVFDEVLTLWALAGAAFQHGPGRLQ